MFDFEAITKAALTNGDKIAAITKGMSPDAQKACESALKLLQAYQEEIPGDVMTALAEAAGLVDESTPEPPVEKSAPPMPPEIKAQFDAVTKAADAQKAELERVTKALDDAKQEKRLGEYVAKAAKMPGLGLEDAKLGVVLKAVDDALLPEVATEVAAMLARASAAITKSAAMQVVGSGQGGAPAGGAGVLEARATEIRKSAPTLTEAQAYRQACEENPAAYKAAMDGGTK